MKINKKIICEIVRKHHGGMENASEQEIMILWNSLDPITQKRYLSETETINKEKADAVSIGPTADNPREFNVG